MSDVFGAAYAGDYDALYREKDYDGEVALIERVIARNIGAARSIVDLGCGTGAHSLRLAARNYDVTGVDRSAEMLAIAREKAKATHSNATFIDGDVTTVRLGKTFDVALMMFAVLGYLTTDSAVHDALVSARAHLAPGGLFIADVWYGPAVLAIQPEARTKIVQSGTKEIIRSVSAALDVASKCASVHYHVEHVDVGSTVAEFEETHTMRYFDDMELESLLEHAGLRLVELRAFDDDDRPATPETWSALVVARAV